MQGRAHQPVRVWEGRTEVDQQQLALCEDVTVRQDPHCRNVRGQCKVNACCHRSLPQQIEPACATPRTPSLKSATTTLTSLCIDSNRACAVQVHATQFDLTSSMPCLMTTVGTPEGHARPTCHPGSKGRPPSGCQLSRPAEEQEAVHTQTHPKSHTLISDVLLPTVLM